MNTPCLYAGDRGSRGWRGWTPGLVILLSALWPVGPLAAQDAAQNVERSFHFIERLSDATELFNAGKPAEALVIYADLASKSPDLDEDGYAAIGVGDCLASLNQNEQARAAYASAVAAHPDLKANVTTRLAELDVAEATEEAIIRLGEAAKSGSATDLWRLGRGLQKRAETILAEASKSFKAAAASQSAELLPGYLARSLTSHVAVLEEFTRDLSAVVEQTESSWSARHVVRLAPKAPGAAIGPTFTTERQKAEYLLQTPEGQRLEVQVRGESDYDAVQVTVNGKVVELSETEKQLVQRYQDRMNTILMEAAKRTDSKTPEGK
jgi:hypothetical protein